MSIGTKLLRASVMISALVWGITVLGQAATYSEGQKVEVREGDTWSSATVLKKEGRRYQIRYADDPNSDEWVTPDRLRLPAGNPPAAGAGNAAGNPAATKPAAPKPAAPAWVNGQKVEVKWGGTYFESTIVNRRGDWYLIEYARHNGQREWVEPWRIRKVGSTEDKVGHARPNPVVRNNAGPPREKPGDPPEPFGAPRAGQEKPKDAITEDPTYKEANTAGAKEVDHNAAAGNVLADASTQPPIPERPVPLRGAAQDVFAKIQAIVIPRAKTGWAYVSHTNGHGDNVAIKLERLDMGAGGAAVFDMGTNLALLDISPDGTQALYRSAGFGAGKSNHVLIYKLDKTEARRTLAFTPYGAEWSTADIAHGFFVDADHVLTLNRERMLLWNLSTAKAVWSCAVDWWCKPALSPGGKYVAVASKGRVLVIEALTGALTANLEAPSTAGVNLAFSPSGKQLVAYAGSVIAWDVTTGKVLSEFSLPKGAAGGSVEMPADGYALMSDRHLLDLERRIVLWTYSNPRGAGAVAPTGQYCYVVTDPNKSSTLRPAKLPHAQALAAARQINPDQALLLKPGSKVALQINAGEAGVEEAIKQRIADAGLVLADDAPARFVASIEQGKSEEREYRPIGRGPFGPTEKVTVTQMISKVALEYDGKVAWESASVSGAGHFLNMKEGQTIQDAVNEASKPNVNFFRSVKIPRYMAMPREPISYGTSSLTPQGIKDGQ